MMQPRFLLVTIVLWIGTLGKITIAAPSNDVACRLLQKPTIPGADVLSIQTRELLNTTVSATPPLLNTNITGLNLCDVDIVISHHGANDSVKIKVWLPSSGWNGRFLATGGSGYAAGLFEYSLAPVVAHGYAAASTDAGLSGDPFSPELWALDAKGHVNMDLLTNFASRSVHDMALAGKSITTQYYGTQPHHSYWSGCSTGGRQGLMAAQTYPEDFDGIVAGAPAIDWARYVVAEQWPQVVMKEESTFISQCVLKAFTDGSLSACDTLDGVEDSVITDLHRCGFDPSSLVGRKVKCNGIEEIITQNVANVMSKILHGPLGPTFQNSYSLNPGTRLDSLANTTLINGTRVGNPFFVNNAWLKFFVEKDPAFDTSTIGYSEFTKLFNQSEEEYGSIIGSHNPDLSKFHSSGGKLLVWHGLADQLIFPQDTINYHRRVETALGNSSIVDQFYRTFLAPGVDHCGGGATAGAVPADPLSALVTWVEDQEAPKVLAARRVNVDGTVITRNICRYPFTSRYLGHGDKNLASSYTCV